MACLRSGRQWQTLNLLKKEKHRGKTQGAETQGAKTQGTEAQGVKTQSVKTQSVKAQGVKAPTQIIPNPESDAANIIPHEVNLRQEAYFGPIPDPDTLKRYGEVMPNLPERIVQSWETEQTHRREHERALVETSQKIDKRSQWFAFILSLLALFIAAYAVYDGQYLYGILFGAVPTLLGGRLLGRFLRLFQKEDKNKE